MLGLVLTVYQSSPNVSLLSRRVAPKPLSRYLLLGAGVRNLLFERGATFGRKFDHELVRTLKGSAAYPESRHEFTFERLLLDGVGGCVEAPSSAHRFAVHMFDSGAQPSNRSELLLRHLGK